MDITQLLGFAVKQDASDVHLSAGEPPMLRIHGDIKRLEHAALTAEDVHTMVFDVMNDQQRKFFQEHLDLDFSFELGELARFRVNVFLQRKGTAAVFRTIPTEVISLDGLAMPPILRELCEKERGLVLVTGPTGSGKSTTLAAMIDYINSTTETHILTVEDPIEFVHKSKKSLINQREVGPHTHSFANALRGALREDPDVILVGEMRDLETVSLALTAAETGHLVFGTIHASSAWQTFGRIYDLFPEAERDQIRKLLAYNLRAIVYQKLLPTLHENIVRIPAVEILLNTPIVQKYILEAREGELLDVIKRSTEEGMIDFTSSLVQLVETEYIHHRVALEATPRPEELKMRLKGIS